MYSASALLNIKDQLLNGIEMLKRENADLEMKLQNFEEPSVPVLKDEIEIFKRELDLSESISGLSFMNVSKENINGSSMKIAANIVCGKEQCSIEVRTKVSDGKVEDLSLHLGDDGFLAEIRSGLMLLIRNQDVTNTLNAISSYARMADLRLNISEELLDLHGDCFAMKLQGEDISDGGIAVECMVLSAFDNKRDKYFEVMWSLDWNMGLLSIVHTFDVTQLSDLKKFPRLEQKLEDLRDTHFTDDIDATAALCDLWRKIGELVSRM